MQQRFRLGLIGFGAVGRLHYEAYLQAKKIEVVAICETAPHLLHALSQSPDLALYSSAAEMLEKERLDIACVLTPPGSHEALVELVAGHGVHIFCEKPLALSADAARRMVDTAHAHGVLLFYGSSYRFLPAVRAAREQILAGAIGDVRLIREQSVGGEGLAKMEVMRASHYPPGGLGGFAMGLADHGVHLIDVMSWMMSSEIVDVHGRGNVSGRAAGPEFLVMTFGNGAIGHLLYDEGSFPTELPGEGAFSQGDGWDADGFVRAGSWTRFPSYIHVHGAKGALRVGHYINQLVRTDETGSTQIPLSGRPSPYHFADQIDAFATDIAEDRAASTPGEVGAEVLDKLLSLYR